MMSSRLSPSALRRAERISASPRFNGRRFVNPQPVSLGFKPGVERPSLRDFLCGGARRVPQGPLPLVDPTASWRSTPASGLRVTRLGHSTLFIEMDGRRILTDPVWGERVSPLAFAGPKRFHRPPAPLSALPPLDLVIVSHDHYDHLDRPTIRALAKSRVPFVTSLGVGTLLERWGVAPERISELDWWERVEVEGITVTAAPAQHFSGRGIKDRNATLWSSMHLRTDRHSFFFGADSGLMPEFREIGERLGPFDIAALEIGAYHPSWGDIHLGPENALIAHAMLGSGALLPIHWGTFNLAMHAWDEPAETIVRHAPDALHLLMPRFGEPVEIGPPAPVDPWWRRVSSEGEVATSTPAPIGSTGFRTDGGARHLHHRAAAPRSARRHGQRRDAQGGIEATAGRQHVHRDASGTEHGARRGDGTLPRIVDHRHTRTRHAPAPIGLDDQRRGLVDADAQVRGAFEHEAHQAIVSPAPQEVLVDDRRA
jgi:L-ascorbate metabolism protein UlaG (beta-lactamase superfamily)